MTDYQKYNFDIVARDQGSYLLRNWLWADSFLKMIKRSKAPRWILGNISRKNELEYIGDLETWKNYHEFLKEKVLEDIKNLEDIMNKSEQIGKDFYNWIQKNLFLRNFKQLNNQELFKLLQELISWQQELLILGTPLPILDFQNFSFLGNNLEKILQEKTSNKQEYNKAYSLFTHPLKNSFAKQEEKYFLEVYKLAYGKKRLISLIEKHDLESIKKQYPNFYKQFKKHVNKYYWIAYGYAGPAYTEKDFLGFLLNLIKQEINPIQRIKEIQKEEEEIEKGNKEYVKKFKLNNFEKKIVSLTRRLVWIKPRRKDYETRGYCEAESLLREIGKRLHLSLKQTRSTPVNLIKEGLLKNKKIDHHYINELYNFHVCVPKNEKEVEILSGKKAKNFSDKIKREGESSDEKSKEIKGEMAFPGKVKGKVKIVNYPEDMESFNKDDILVSHATNPSLLPAMKKAKGFITDEGGLTCHASIVAREFQKPCVIGTKNGTQILKDGDLVDVDASHGKVNIVKNK